MSPDNDILIWKILHLEFVQVDLPAAFVPPLVSTLRIQKQKQKNKKTNIKTNTNKKLTQTQMQKNTNTTTRTQSTTQRWEYQNLSTCKPTDGKRNEISKQQNLYS